ncbi:MAG: TerB N-terminal domain-containing protein [Candidatus Thiodiazotropha sp. (ex Myrtea sp. 'scaly one' KF741663)]|nr:TerB N-terminal domain-containing protein [Candidatus Thiodiazotropha sp. (ex Myrtea sp. 'scaly one' KF741663)]
MARRKSSVSGWLLAGLIALGLLVQAVEKYWPLFLTIGTFALIIWLVAVFRTKPQVTSEAHTPRKRARSSSRHDFASLDDSPAYGASEISPAKLSKDSEKFWVAPGASRSLKGYELGDMIYFGTGLAGGTGVFIEPALVDPKLRINTKGAEYTVRQLNYWPSYTQASPEARAAYLKWLAQGREDPKTDIGYVFLYFYGLERRALVDSFQSKQAQAELAAIEREVQRLLSVYSYNNSFHFYASSFRDWLMVRRGNLPRPVDPPPLEQGELNLVHRYCLGQFALSKTPLPAPWALTWLHGDPAARLRTPATRCPDIFKRAFMRQYALDHGEGLKLPINKTRLKVIHQPGNRVLYNTGTTKIILDQPDVTVLSSPLKKLQATADTCMAQIDSYSRYIGRNPDRAESADALVELPFPLWPPRTQQRIAKLAYTLRTAGKPMATPFEKLQSLLPEWDGVTRKKYQGLTRVLSEAGLGIEPDFAFGGKLPKPDAKIVLFSDEHIATHPDATPEYAAAALTLRLAVAVSAADGNVGSEERDLLERQLEDWLHLDPSHRRRLQAHMRWLISDPPPLGNLKKHIEDLPTYAREAIGDFMTEVAKADNQVTPEEVKLLEKVYKLLDLEVQGLYSKLHTVAEGPVTVRPVGGSTTGHTIPPPPAPPAPAKPSDDLDMERIAVLHAESEKVSNILSKIFTETMPEPEPEPIPDPDDEIDTRDSLLSLDDAHSIFARKLLTRTEWSRDELEELAEDHGMLLDGALETINEAAFDTHDMPLTEGDEPIEINQEIIEELTA